ncbi:carboxymuconolactone decarboxylase family protein [Serratia liquefaciens]|uniref:carboxymuconolactone decarboxylase family protein n=1 Tax=Serratia liquefaciens TaxID=614 RepID=UPI0021843337|nr:carboxymuconolactone decarboxylase family protein [Serratia liquefaciens]CAI2527395.1 Argininosuccinate synthase [Serratia liquefaciens]
MIKQRLKYSELSPAPYKGMVTALMALEKGALDKATIELMFMRVSQINGCAYCLDMHGKALRESGVDNAKLDQLAGWPVSHAFSNRERAALEWADSVTLIAATGAPDSAFEALQAHFSDAEIADLTFAISIMNAFNRLAISMRQ